MNMNNNFIECIKCKSKYDFISGNKYDAPKYYNNQKIS